MKARFKWHIKRLCQWDVVER